jgi:hypothetical protein
MRNGIALISALAALIALAPLAANAQDTTQGTRAQMIQRLAAACEGKSAGDPCSFTRRDGKSADGSCVSHQTRSGSELFCLTANAEQRLNQSNSGMSGGILHRLMGGSSAGGQ